MHKCFLHAIEVCAQGATNGELLAREFLNLTPHLSKYIEYCVGFDAGNELQQQLAHEHKVFG